MCVSVLVRIPAKITAFRRANFSVRKIVVTVTTTTFIDAANSEVDSSDDETRARVDQIAFRVVRQIEMLLLGDTLALCIFH